MRQWIPLSVLLLLLLTWPLTYRYTSLGFDSDATDGAGIISTYYRTRWPGDGVWMIGYLIERHPNRDKPIEAFDLGGTFFERSRGIPPLTWANRLGFWWVNVDRGRGDTYSPVAPHAERALLVGFPHWLLVVAVGAWCTGGSRRRGKTDAGATIGH